MQIIPSATATGSHPLHINVFYAKVLADAAIAQHDILENITTLVLAGADLTAKTTADTTSNEEAGFPLFDEVLPGGLTPMQVAETVAADLPVRKRRRAPHGHRPARALSRRV